MKTYLPTKIFNRISLLESEVGKLKSLKSSLLMFPANASRVLVALKVAVGAFPKKETGSAYVKKTRKSWDRKLRKTWYGK